MDELFQVVDSEGKTYSGWNNVLGLYRSERTARIQLKKELAHQQANAKWRAETGRPEIAYPTLKIQKATIEWEDIDGPRALDQG